MLTLSPVLIGSSITIFVGFILTVVGVFSPGWIPFTGLFKVCYLGIACRSIDLNEMPPYFRATAALEIIAFLAALVCLVSAALYLVLRYLSKASQVVVYLPKVVLISASVAAASGIIGCIIFAAETFKGGILAPDYAFILAIIGVIILDVGGFIFYKHDHISQVVGVLQV